MSPSGVLTWLGEVGDDLCPRVQRGLVLMAGWGGVGGGVPVSFSVASQKLCGGDWGGWWWRACQLIVVLRSCVAATGVGGGVPVSSCGIAEAVWRRLGCESKLNDFILN